MGQQFQDSVVFILGMYIMLSFFFKKQLFVQIDSSPQC